MKEHQDDVLGITRDGIHFACWRNGRVWELAATLPVDIVPLSEFAALLDETEVWSNRDLAHKSARIMAADLAYPVIFSSHGWLFDGAHRVMKATALGLTEIRAVRFLTDPEPDYWRQEPQTPPTDAAPTQG